MKGLFLSKGKVWNSRRSIHVQNVFEWSQLRNQFIAAYDGTSAFMAAPEIFREFEIYLEIFNRYIFTYLWNIFLSKLCIKQLRA